MVRYETFFTTSWHWSWAHCYHEALKRAGGRSRSWDQAYMDAGGLARTNALAIVDLHRLPQPHEWHVSGLNCSQAAQMIMYMTDNVQQAGMENMSMALTLPFRIFYLPYGQITNDTMIKDALWDFSRLNT
ncbi:MAG: hypothetical protein ACLU3F_14720 [Blautia wexlerae]